MKAPKRITLLLLFLVALLGAVPPCQASEGQTVASFNFNDTDIRTVIKSVAKLTGKNFIIDPHVVGKVNIVSSQPLPIDELYNAFLDLLQVHGYAAIEDGAVIKIVPQAGGQEFAVPMTDDGRRGAPGELVTRIHKLHHVPAAKLQAILKPLMPTKSQLTAHPASNTLIITDMAGNIDRLITIINRIDQASSGNIEIVRLEYADARDVLAILENLELKTGKITADQLQMVADDRTNSILLAGDSDVVLHLKTLITDLDSPVENAGSTMVIFLRFAKAKDLEPILSGMDLPEANSGAAPPGTRKTAPQSTTKIKADPNTNALIITAPPAAMKTLQSVIRQLDVRRAQVMIEAIIAEVSTSKAAELGVQWQSTDAVSGNNNGAIGGTNFNSTTTGGSITQLAVNPLSVGDGLTLGFFTGTTTILGSQIINLGALLRALTSDTDTNILSTPSLVTLDNEEAEITVGQNVPFVTGSYTTVGTSSTPQSPFQTIDRRDIGVKLKVKPQINEGDTIRLDIQQEVSNLTDTVNEGGTVTNTRSIKTSVMVDNSKVLVLGGLISDDIQDGVQKVPVLGSIPILGYLFRYNKSRHVKRNLMVFLKPIIIRDESASARITFDKYDYMRRHQQEFRPDGIPLMPGATIPVLPERSQEGQAAVPAPQP